MKEIYSFPVERKIEKTIPVLKKTETGETIESSEKIIDSENVRVVFVKPNMAKIEEAEFFYGQKFNEFINSGFLTKAMLNKKMGDHGGYASKVSIELLQKAFVDNYEAAKVIEFYSAASNLTEEQALKLQQAKEEYASSQNTIFEYEQSLRSQFSQTADAKAEQKLIEWLVLHLSFYEDEVDSKKQLFPLFEGDSYNNKRDVYLNLCDDLDESSNSQIIKLKSVFDKSFETLARVASIWYNKIGEDQKTIQQALDEMFGPEIVEEPKEKKKPKTSKKNVDEQEQAS